MNIYEYQSAQVDLACLDTVCGDFSEYRVCLGFGFGIPSLCSINACFAMHGALPFEDHERETDAERDARWFALLRAA